MLYSSPLDALETASMVLISGPREASCTEIAEALSLTLEEFGTTISAFTSTKGFTPISSASELGMFEGNTELTEKFIKWGVMEVAGTAKPVSAGYDDSGEMNDEGIEIFASDETGGVLGGEDGAIDFDAILNDLIDMFKEKNGREPTEEEVKIWVEQMQGLSEGGDEEGGEDNLENLEVIGSAAGA
jgi:hypothetical protein